MKKCLFNKMLSFLNDLEGGKISYSLHHYRDNAIMITVAAPGERWEIEFLDDGSIEIERFVSNGEIFGEKALSELLTTHSDLVGWVEKDLNQSLA